MRIGQTEILDTYAEAFGARYTRLIITAADDYWLDAALRSLTGYGTSVIGCDAEAGVERHSAGGRIAGRSARRGCVAVRFHRRNRRPGGPAPCRPVCPHVPFHRVL